MRTVKINKKAANLYQWGAQSPQRGRTVSPLWAAGIGEKKKLGEVEFLYRGFWPRGGNVDRNQKEEKCRSRRAETGDRKNGKNRGRKGQTLSWLSLWVFSRQDRGAGLSET